MKIMAYPKNDWKACLPACSLACSLPRLLAFHENATSASNISSNFESKYWRFHNMWNLTSDLGTMFWNILTLHPRSQNQNFRQPVPNCICWVTYSNLLLWATMRLLQNLSYSTQMVSLIVQINAICMYPILL